MAVDIGAVRAVYDKRKAADKAQAEQKQAAAAPRGPVVSGRPTANAQMFAAPAGYQTQTRVGVAPQPGQAQVAPAPNMVQAQPYTGGDGRDGALAGMGPDQMLGRLGRPRPGMVTAPGMLAPQPGRMPFDPNALRAALERRRMAASGMPQALPWG